MTARVSDAPPAAIEPQAAIGDEIRAARAALQAAGSRLAARGLIVASEGNLSARLTADLLLITPAGCRKDVLALEDFVLTSVSAPSPDQPAEPLAPEPFHDAGRQARASSDLGIHRAIYEARPDVRAIVHAHAPSALALMLAGELPDLDALAEVRPVIGSLARVAAAPMGSQQLANLIADALSAQSEPSAGAALLDRHGVITVGATLDQALDRMETVDLLCRVWRDATLLRAAKGR